MICCGICGCEFVPIQNQGRRQKYCSDECRAEKRRATWRAKRFIRPSIERLREVLDYSPTSGEFIWKVQLARRAKAGTNAGRVGYLGYRYIGIDGAIYKEHRVAWAHYHGEWVKQIDHINHDPADNRIANLRPSTQKQNAHNVSKHKDNISGYKGVSYSPRSQRRKRWYARIMIDGQKKSLGYYMTADEAARAYNEAAAKYHGEFACLNELAQEAT